MDENTITKKEYKFMKQLTCGVIIINSDNKILGCKAYGKGDIGQIYDIPKGKLEPNETPVQTAIRETKEETGLNLNNIKLKDLGEFKYNSKKRLHLFKCKLDPNINDMYCKSRFDVNGVSRPEMVGYKFFNFNEISDNFYKNLGRVLNNILNNEK